MKFPIPDTALSKHIGFLGTNGSGKTSACKSAVIEPALDASERVLVIDPTGVWWGLRISATGKSKGYPIYVFGGDHGDYPLRAKDAAALAEAFGTSSDSAIFDTSQMTVTDRTLFFTHFAETLLRKNRGPVKLVIDEAHLFMPQSGARGGGLVPDMLHAGNNLVSLGRSKGLRISLISQRPAKLHKDSLTQVQSLVAMRLIAPQDRAAIKDWIGDQADPGQGEQIIASLPGLAPGEAWVWAPLDASLERVKFPRPRTFDSSSAPDQHDGDGPQLAPINLDALKGKLATIEAEIKAADPKALQAEIARLKGELAKAPTTETINIGTMIDAVMSKGYVVMTDAQITEELASFDAAGYARGHHQASTDANRHVARMQNVWDSVAPGVLALQTAFKDLVDASENQLAADLSKSVPPGVPTPRPPVTRTSPSTSVRATPSPGAGGDGSLPGPQQRILNSLATWRAMGHGYASNAQVAWLAGYSPTSTGYTNPRGALKSSGLVEYPMPDHVTLTGNGGAKAVADVPADLRAFVLAQLPGPEARILKAAIAIYPKHDSNEAIAEAAGYSHTSTGYTNPRGALKTKELVTYPTSGMVRAADWLFA